MNFGEFRTWFDERFTILLERKIANFITHSTNQDIPKIVSHLLPIAKNGKRFRPFLVYSASSVDTFEAENQFLLFASVELLHIFALIHDDIMDNADTRHGVVCAHKKFIDEYSPQTSEAIAILLGDLVFAWSYECLNEYTSNHPQRRDRITKEFTQLVSEVTHGQMLDILAPVQPPLTESQILEKMILKTARYSFVQPLHLGFIISGDKKDDHEFSEKFGVAIGIAFQLQDDLLDTYPSEQTGKSQFSDIENKNQTLLSQYIFRSNTQNSTTLLNFWGKPVDTDQKRHLLTELFTESGAIADIKTRIALYLTIAQETLSARNKTEQEKWNCIIELIAQRKK
jgi:geranylgeranyl diphosphate synthase type I